MSQDFRLKFNKMRENNPAAIGSAPESEGSADINYPGSGNGRNLAFIFADGRMQFLNYSYLVSCEYLPEENSIVMCFTTHNVKLKGTQLENLFYDLMVQTPKFIVCEDGRYNAITEKDQPAVNEITISENK